MADFSATDVAFTGIRFVRERPRAVAVWAGVQVIISLVFGVVSIGLMGPYMVQLRALNTPGQRSRPGAGPAHPGPCRAAHRPAARLQPAVPRDALRDHRAGRAAARRRAPWLHPLRMDEARQLLLTLLLFAVVIAAEVVGTIVVLVPAIVASVMSHGLGR
ncbi:MAG: hypothetical protein WDN45_12945 [Caulobacteraceae bacterium]